MSKRKITQEEYEQYFKEIEADCKRAKVYDQFRTTPEKAIKNAKKLSKNIPNMPSEYPKSLPEEFKAIQIPIYIPKELRSTIIYLLLGQAVGDAVGLASEFLDKEMTMAYYKGQHITYDHYLIDRHRSRWMNQDFRCADWTDDTDQCLLILDSIIRHNGECNEIDFAQRLYHWLYFGYSELGDLGALGLGANVQKVTTTENWVLNPIEISERVWIEGGKKSAPNGSVMRTSVASIPYFWDEEKVIENARKYGKITHADPRCQASVTTIVSILSKLLQGRNDISQIIEEAITRGEKDIIDLNQKEDYYNYVYATDFTQLKLNESIGYPFKPVGCAILSLRLAEKMIKEGKNKTDIFIQLMESIVYEAGDANTNGCVVGAVLGAYLKDNCIPNEWLEFDNKLWLFDRINRILKLYNLEPIN